MNAGIPVWTIDLAIGPFPLDLARKQQTTRRQTDAPPATGLSGEEEDNQSRPLRELALMTSVDVAGRTGRNGGERSPLKTWR